MAKLNQAYDGLDEGAIRAIMLEWEAEEPIHEKLDLDEQLVRVVGQIARVRKRLHEISDELEDLTLTEMFQLKKISSLPSWRGVTCFRKSPKAQYNLGVVYFNGVGVPCDHEEAFKWFAKAAEKGSAPGQGFLGVMHEKGLGVDQNDEMSLHWYQKAAEQEDSTA